MLGQVRLLPIPPRDQSGGEVMHHVAKSDEGVMADRCLSAWPSFLGSTRPRSFGHLLANVSWVARPAN
jgi:hypothetical protein